MSILAINEKNYIGWPLKMIKFDGITIETNRQKIKERSLFTTPSRQYSIRFQYLNDSVEEETIGDEDFSIVKSALYNDDIIKILGPELSQHVILFYENMKTSVFIENKYLTKEIKDKLKKNFIQSKIIEVGLCVGLNEFDSIYSILYHNSQDHISNAELQLFAYGKFMAAEIKDKSTAYLKRGTICWPYFDD